MSENTGKKSPVGQIAHVLLLVILTALIVWRLQPLFKSADEAQTYPKNPIQIVVPYSAGGGTDTFTRMVVKVINEKEMLPRPMVVQNIPGGGGTIASRDVKDADPDGYTLLCHQEALITSQLSGAVEFGPEAFRPVAQTAAFTLLIVVREDCKFQNVKDMMEEAKASPGTIRFGADQGSPAHFTAKTLEKAMPGAKLNLVTVGGGAKRYANIIGGDLEGGIFSLAEFLGFVSPEGTPPDKNIRILGVLSPERHPDVPDAPTCVEVGINALSSNAYYWWAPKGISEDVVKVLADTFEKAMADETLIAQLKARSFTPSFSRDKALMDRLKGRMEALAPLAERAEDRLPNFPLYTGIAVGVLFIWVLVTAVTEKMKSDPEKEEDRDVSEAADISSEKPVLHVGVVIGTIAVLAIYTALLEWTKLPFVLLTLLMVFLVGLLLSIEQRFAPRTLYRLALLAGLTSLGCEYIFTQVFTILLP